MKIIHNTRRSGKTTQLINRSSIFGGTIVCNNHEEAQRIFRIAKEEEKTIPFPVTYHEFINKKFRGKNITEFYIDNLDCFLSIFSDNIPVNTVTINKELPDTNFVNIENVNEFYSRINPFTKSFTKS